MGKLDITFFEKLFNEIIKKAEDTTMPVTTMLAKASEKMKADLPKLKDTKVNISYENIPDATDFLSAKMEDGKEKSLKSLHSEITNWTAKMLDKVKAGVEVNRTAISESFGILHTILQQQAEQGQSLASLAAKVAEVEKTLASLDTIRQQLEEEKKQMEDDKATMREQMEAEKVAMKEQLKVEKAKLEEEKAKLKAEKEKLDLKVDESTKGASKATLS